MSTVDAHLRREFYAAYEDPSLAVLEGFHPAKHALTFEAELTLAVTYDRQKLLQMARRLSPDVVPAIERVLHVVDQTQFAKLSRRSLSSPLLSIASRPEQDITSHFAASGRPVLYLENPRNPGNVGAVIRVAAAAAIEAVVVSGEVDPWSPVVLRSGAGLQFALPVGNAELPWPTDRPVVTVDAGGEPIATADLDPNSVLVVGGERYGISTRVRQMAKQSVALPMRPGVSSLNLATAVSALLYSWKATALTRTGCDPW